MRRKPARFVRVARKIAEALGTEDCLLAGGLAVMAYGFVRATRDVDLLTRLPLAEARARLEASGLPTRLLKGDPLEGGFSCLKGECDGLPFDVLPQLVPVHWEAAPRVEGRGAGSLRVVPLVDLLALKLKAQGPKDLMDAAILVLLHPETEARALELATAYRVLDRFEHWLRDPRTQAQAREEAEFERRRAVRPGSRRAGAKVPPPRRTRKPSER
ncbi:MAG TPA: hypothetical protein VE359_01090 [Vicinamibacteria bacterium]|nr:hypothetical protein [Vicinamibacteria bacterium]